MNFIERRIENKLDKMFGDADPVLRDIVRMDWTQTGTEMNKQQIASNLEEIKIHHLQLLDFVEKEMLLTLDACGNEIFVNDINAVVVETTVFDEQENPIQ